LSAVFSSDVVVVGSGPAGSVTALFLARAGFDVALLDRSPFPRPKPCGEYLTPGAVRLLRDEIGVLPELMRQGAARLTRETVVPHRAAPFGGATDALACPRIVTDTVLRDAARAAGARVFDGISVREVLRDGAGVRGVSGTDDNGAPVEFRAKVTVGADGSRSLLARTLGVVRPISRLQRLALVAHYAPADGDIAEDEAGTAVTMHLPRDGSDACCGVGPACGPDRARNVNLVVPLSEAPRMAGRRQAYFESCLRDAFPEVWEGVRDAPMTGPLLSVGCFGHHTTRAAGDGAVLVGDAATFIHPFTGEGVYFALRGAQMASDAIARALEAGDVSRRGLRGYDSARRADLLPRYRLCDAVQRVVHSPPLLAWASSRLRRSEPLTDLLLRAVGDLARPADLFSLGTLRLAL